MRLTMENFNIFWVHWKIWFFLFLGGGGWVTKKQYRQGNCLKRGLGQFVDLREGLARIMGVVFLRVGWYPNAHYETDNWLLLLRMPSFYRIVGEKKINLCSNWLPTLKRPNQIPNIYHTSAPFCPILFWVLSLLCLEHR